MREDLVHPPGECRIIEINAVRVETREAGEAGDRNHFEKRRNAEGHQGGAGPPEEREPGQWRRLSMRRSGMNHIRATTTYSPHETAGWNAASAIPRR